MAKVRQVQQGFLVIADVSGYTAFLTGTEFDHAQAIMEELTKLVLDHVRAPLKLVKLEGDAVFYYARDEALPDAERLLDQMEACYADFAGRIRNMELSTTCPCAACASIPTLDLRFFAHYGEYIVQRIGRTAEDLAGPDVILLHRLVKNNVTRATGLRAYALLTDACIERMGRSLPLVPHAETYEHLGEVRGGVHDLGAVEKAAREARRVYVEPAAADIVYERIVHATPEVLWSFMVDPARRVLWQAGLRNVVVKPNASGRLSSGAEIHCIHGPYSDIAWILDWRPFRYFTVQCRFRPTWIAPANWTTFEFVPVGVEQTRVSIQVHSLRRDWLTIRFLCTVVQPILRRQQDTSFDRLDRILADPFDK